MSAAVLSRVLRAGGLRPLPSGTPHSREGIRVSGDYVRIAVDSDRLAASLADDARRILTGAGYNVTTIGPRVLRADHLGREERQS